MEENKSPVKEDPLFVVQSIDRSTENTENRKIDGFKIEENITMNSPKPQ